MQGNRKFSVHLRNLMLSNHMTAYELSQKSGISKSYIYHMISGKMYNPTIEVCTRLAYSLGIEVEEMLDYRSDYNEE